MLMHVPLELKNAPMFGFWMKGTRAALQAARAIGGYPAVIRGEGRF